MHVQLTRRPCKVFIKPVSLALCRMAAVMDSTCYPIHCQSQVAVSGGNVSPAIRYCVDQRSLFVMQPVLHAVCFDLLTGPDFFKGFCLILKMPDWKGACTDAQLSSSKMCSLSNCIQSASVAAGGEANGFRTLLPGQVGVSIILACGGFCAYHRQCRTELSKGPAIFGTLLRTQAPSNESSRMLWLSIGIRSRFCYCHGAITRNTYEEHAKT